MVRPVFGLVGLWLVNFQGARSCQEARLGGRDLSGDTTIGAPGGAIDGDDQGKGVPIAHLAIAGKLRQEIFVTAKPGPSDTSINASGLRRKAKESPMTRPFGRLSRQLGRSKSARAPTRIPRDPASQPGAPAPTLHISKKRSSGSAGNGGRRNGQGPYQVSGIIAALSTTAGREAMHSSRI